MSRKALLALAALLLTFLSVTIVRADSNSGNGPRSGRETPPPSRAIPSDVVEAPDADTAEPPPATEPAAPAAEPAVEESATLSVADILLATQIARGVQQAAYRMTVLNMLNADVAEPSPEDTPDAAAAPEIAPPAEPLPADAPAEPPLTEDAMSLVGGRSATVALQDTAVIDDPLATVEDPAEPAAASNEAEQSAPPAAKETAAEAEPPRWHSRIERAGDRPAKPVAETKDPTPADEQPAAPDAAPEQPEADAPPATEAVRRVADPAADQSAAALIEVNPPEAAAPAGAEAGVAEAPARPDPVHVPEKPNTTLDALGIGGGSGTSWGNPTPSTENGDPPTADEPASPASPTVPDAAEAIRHYTGWLVLAPAAAAAGNPRSSGVSAPSTLLLPGELRPQMSEFAVPKSIMMLHRGSAKHKQVALTFDDGPHPEFTSQILGILDYYDIPATFFFTGVQAQKYPQWVQMAHQAGHEIGNHTYDHFRLPNLPKQEQEYQIDEFERLIEGLVGETPRFLRPPGGQIDAQVEQVINQRGMIVAMWDVALNDTQDGKTKVELLGTSLKKIRNGSVILAHDGIQATIDMLPELIETLQSKGYEFVTMSELASGL